MAEAAEGGEVKRERPQGSRDTEWPQGVGGHKLLTKK